MRFLYVMDPMCSWCYGFQPQLESFLQQHPYAQLEWIMGGLAADTNIPMNENLKRKITAHWQQIEEQTQVKFNYKFWQLNTPYRSTYPACRAVIAAEILMPKASKNMVKAIQSAYYLEAKNPSLHSTLVTCAQSINLDGEKFLELVASDAVEQCLKQHLSTARQLQVTGFPAFFYINDRDTAHPLTLGFCQAEKLQMRLATLNEDSR